MSGDDGREPSDSSSTSGRSTREPRDRSDTPNPASEANGSRSTVEESRPSPDRDLPSGSRGSTTGRQDGGRGPKDLLVEFWTAESGVLLYLREVVTSVAAVAAVGLLLFAISGVWPPMVAVESGSMEPHMHKGDLVFVTEPGRFVPEYADEHAGVVTRTIATERGYRTFGGYGSVIVYDNPDRVGPPIIHRAHFWVESGENWYDRADPDAVDAENCEELLNCPAPSAGYITKGDNNGEYDQANGISPPVRPSWITGIARVRVPYLGWVRLTLASISTGDPVGTVVPDVGRFGGLDDPNLEVALDVTTGAQAASPDGPAALGRTGTNETRTGPGGPGPDDLVVPRGSSLAVA